MRRVLIIIPIVVALLASLIYSQQRSGPYFVSGLIEADEARLGSRVGGRVREVLVHEGQSVTAGQTLVTLDPFTLHEELAEARATLAAYQARLQLLQAGYRGEEIQQASARRDRFNALLERRVAGSRPLEIQVLRENLAYAEADLKFAQSEYERVMGLAERTDAARREIDNARLLLERAQARLRGARSELELAEEGSRAEDIAEARAQLAESEQALALLKAGFRGEEISEAQARVQAASAAVESILRRLAETELKAPFDGVIEAADLEPGDLIAANAPVISLLDSRTLWVRAYVPENRLDLKLDQRVSLRVDAFPDRRFAGHIGFIARQAEFTPSNAQTPEERSKQVFRIKVLIDEGREMLRAGMSADVFLEPAP